MSDEMEPQSSLDKRAETESGTKPSIGASAKPKLTGSEQPNLTVLELASVEDFAQTKIGSLLQVIDTLDFYAIDLKLRALYLQASAEGNHAAYRAYRVLMIVCSYHFSIDRQDAFGPMAIKDSKRTPIPSDIAGAQSQVLALIAEQIDHPLLRARIADVAWYNHRNLQTSASLAIESYCEAIAFYLEDKLSFAYEPPSGLSAKIVDLMARVFQIIVGTGKQKALPHIAVATWSRLYAQAQDLSCFTSLNRLALLGQSAKLIEWTQVAQDAERAAEVSEPNHYAMAVKDVWELAAQAYKHSKDHDAFKRCKLKSIEQTLKMREGVDSCMARAGWTREAIRELRLIPGMQVEQEKLRIELLELQAQAAHEFSPFSTPIDFSDERKGTVDIFKSLTLPDFFYTFTRICTIPEKMALHTDIIKSRSDSLLSDLFNGRIYTDALGRVISQAPSINLNETPPPEWYDHECLFYLGFHYHTWVESRIKPAAQTLMTNFAIDDRHLIAIVSISPFVAPGFKETYALGLARFLQFDMMSACHLLFPQLENSLRHVLSDIGIDTSKLDEEMLQEDRSISGLLKHRREPLEQIFGIDLIYTIDLLFNLKGGPCLRHELAHGKLAPGSCYHASSIYACWLMYYLACLPLLPYWKTHVAPKLELIAL